MSAMILRAWNLLCQGMTEAAYWELCSSTDHQHHQSLPQVYLFVEAKILAARNSIPSAIDLLRDGGKKSQGLCIQNCLFLGQLLLEQQSFEEATHQLENAYQSSSMNLQPEEADCFSQMMPEIFSFQSLRLMILAKCYHALGNVESCIRYAKAALEADFENLELLAWIEKFCILPSRDGNFLTKCSSFSIAFSLNQQRQYSQSLELTSRAWSGDLEWWLPLHISNLFHTKNRLSLYKLGCDLFKRCPSTSPMPFIAVGALYLLANSAATSESHHGCQRSKNAVENARKYFCKATLLSKTCHWAWEGFALTFSLSFDHEQAIAAYSTLAKLIPASAEPYIAIACEYSKNENALLALKYFDKALEMRPPKTLLPFLFNELSTLHFKEGKYAEAVACLEQAVQAATEAHPGQGSEFLGVLFINLGYSRGMSGDWQSAINAFEQSISIWPCKQASYALAVAKAIESAGCQESMEILVGLLQPGEEDSIDEFYDFAISQHSF